MPPDRVLKFMNTAHRAVLQVSGGRVGWKFKQMPVVELTTVGRRSGLRRTVLLCVPVCEGSTLVLVASRGGDDRHPSWFLNLRDDPDVEVSVEGKTPRSMRARVATAEERNRLWPKVTAAYDGYAGYQRRTTREIPLVLLEPVS